MSGGKVETGHEVEELAQRTDPVAAHCKAHRSERSQRRGPDDDPHDVEENPLAPSHDSQDRLTAVPQGRDGEGAQNGHEKDSGEYRPSRTRRRRIEG